MYPKRKQVFIRLVHFLVLHKNLWLTSDLVPFICHHSWQLGLGFENGDWFSLLFILWDDDPMEMPFLATMQWVLPCPFDVHLSSPYRPGFCSLIHSLIWMSLSRHLVWSSPRTTPRIISPKSGTETASRNPDHNYMNPLRGWTSSSWGTCTLPRITMRRA